VAVFLPALVLLSQTKPLMCVTEFNQPIITYKDAKCCIPINPCALDVVDEVTVLYLDSPVLDKIVSCIDSGL
jgi:hypothetical protein